MQKQRQIPLTYLQSDGDTYPVPESIEADIGSLLTSPQTTIQSERKKSFQSPFRLKRSHQILEYTEQLYVWNSYLSRKFVSS
ncbi:unnamed protein product (macronuclear) [Paramecium tetraurelia]|uniref:Uncharacterized protein n=2 Tax=Paramecium TaxID=5884 RepID=A0CNM3_PARTE|nr:uncharacterized protein GSPATT00008832001 [Paramecium tetraurelia]CAD8159220.1 unnamed protein product [Paramecium octaurelia]CAK72390.1 unnamed protein product [Paramecium tetraurelia]|eukprot:XP_001439787.1 hypothetical protein (macronuclear) [Paramecium tetraurelia strain d4-2]